MIVGAIQARPPETTMQRKVPENLQVTDGASEALGRLGNVNEAAAHSRKAFAEERLKQLREQMNKLMLFDMAPAALAGQSAQLARELNGAASDFAATFRDLAQSRLASAEGLSLAQQAYLGFGDAEAAVPPPPTLSAADMDTLEGFTEAARRIESLADNASERLRTGSDAAQAANAARSTALAVIETMSDLSESFAPRSFYW